MYSTFWTHVDSARDWFDGLFGNRFETAVACIVAYYYYYSHV